MQEHFTKTPNLLFDKLLTELNYSELKILLVIIRQTYGWIDKETGRRKEKDRITIGQFQNKARLSRRIISETIKRLVEKRLIVVTDNDGNVLDKPSERKGRFFLYYSATCANYDTNLCRLQHKPVQNMEHNKRKENKRNETKEINIEHISKILEKMKSKWK